MGGLGALSSVGLLADSRKVLVITPVAFGKKPDPHYGALDHMRIPFRNRNEVEIHL